MASLEHLDLLLGEALENMMGAAAEVRALDLPTSKDDLKHIGQATGDLWAIRQRLYEMRPDIRRDFDREIEENPQRYEELNELAHRAACAETAGDLDSARCHYTDLLKRAQYGWFRLRAEAGLHRTMETERPNHGAHGSLAPRRGSAP